MDENLRIGLHTADEYVPLEQVSRGTIEQAYFALRMAAMDVLCGEEELPVILDESFAFYDENRLNVRFTRIGQPRRQSTMWHSASADPRPQSPSVFPFFRNEPYQEYVRETIDKLMAGELDARLVYRIMKS